MILVWEPAAVIRSKYGIESLRSMAAGEGACMCGNGMVDESTKVKAARGI